MAEEWLWSSECIAADSLIAADAHHVLPEGSTPKFAANDIAYVYRQCPVSERDASVSVIAVWVERAKRWQFGEMHD